MKNKKVFGQVLNVEVTKNFYFLLSKEIMKLTDSKKLVKINSKKKTKT